MDGCVCVCICEFVIIILVWCKSELEKIHMHIEYHILVTMLAEERTSAKKIKVELRGTKIVRFIFFFSSDLLYVR